MTLFDYFVFAVLSVVFPHIALFIVFIYILLALPLIFVLLLPELISLLCLLGLFLFAVAVEVALKNLATILVAQYKRRRRIWRENRRRRLRAFESGSQ